MCEPSTAMMIASTVLGTKSGMDSRKEMKRERKKAEEDRLKLSRERAEESKRAKLSEYTQTRSLSRKASRRGRASTILDKRDTLG